MSSKQLTADQLAELLDAAQTVVAFAAEVREQYAHTKEWTALPDGSCMTIRVPTALLNRIRDLGDLLAEGGAA